ncbi:amino acid ABC transporter ATP-binding/permease protein [Staphylococcus sp. SQ8-PEA]|uniref:Amino acid ABC transporter ATP-binding/permease protein n=1 Tax=Staphylococcus marylandisciuri TaxID=2981529 RepID=A0ABT2QP79_9STAP|nr:amino acid ABC transporter ATP-binding/permease protein [Staphylococcus marylandisciuri]MCU5745783.1 amino acid ABC transporter ATP-binding/permease protein [Staphylococcus marylandisciuri]
MKSHIKIRGDRDLVISIIVGVIGGVVALGMFFLSGYMVTESALGAPLFALLVLTVTVKMFGFLRAIARYIERLLSHRTTFTMLRDLRVQMYRDLIPVVPDVYRRFKPNNLLRRLINSVETFQNIYLRVYYPPIVIGITAVIAMVSLITISYVHALIIVISMLISLLVVPWLSAKKAQILMKEVSRGEQKFLNQFYDYKEGYYELRRFDQEKVYESSLHKQADKYVNLQYREQRFLLIYDFSLNLVSMLALFLTIGLGVLQVQAHELHIIYLTSIVLMLLTLFEQAVPMSNVAFYKAQTTRAREEINEILNNSKGSQTTNAHTIAENGEYELSMTDVNFKFEHQQHRLLKHIQLDIKKGEHVAIIGPSGSGKSTLLQLMLGLYSNDEGEVYYRGRPVSSMSDEEKYHYMNGLLQRQQLFDGELQDNLFTRADQSIVRSTLNALGLQHLSLEKEVTLEGRTLSGGEVERLALARLFFRDCPLWILDEPTTALDQSATEKVMTAIQQRAETLVIATHNIDLLSRFDRIVVMKDGVIVEDGSYRKLMNEASYLKRVVDMSAT